MRAHQQRALAIVPALALLLLPAPGRPSSEGTVPPPGSIAGVVRDAGGAPLSGAHVFVVSTAHATRTDRAGRYRLEGVPAGSWTVAAALGGYEESRADSVAVRPGATTRHDFTLNSLPGEQVSVAAAAPPARAAADELKSVRAERHGGNDPRYRIRREPWNTEEYGRIYENRYLDARSNPLSTFSIDVDRASYSNVRRFLMQGQLPPEDAVRIEELVNYFSYAYAEPTGEHPFSVAADVAPAPWNPDHQLVRIGLQGRRYSSREIPPSNLVFLIDVSGSMASPDKLPLVKQAFRVLVRELRDEDRVAIVVYAGSAGLVLPPTPGSEKPVILAALDRLEAGGSTAGGAGIRLAYDMARRHHVPEGNNRVIIATDGDFNVGTSSEGELVRLIEEKRAQGTWLTVLGFGTGNYKDGRMEQLADKGNGNYAYIDNLLEANKVFGRELTSTLFTIAKDVKVQVEFNPARVQAYRLIGYENRLLAREDFNDDEKDAGELGAGHTVTALYEIVPAGAPMDVNTGGTDPLRYQPNPEPAPDRSTEQSATAHSATAHPDEWLTVKLRYKPPRSDRSRLLTETVRDRDVRERVSGDFAFAASVAAFGMTLRNSEHRGSAGFDQVLELARASRGEDRDGYRAEFIRLVELARSMGVAVRE